MDDTARLLILNGFSYLKSEEAVLQQVKDAGFTDVTLDDVRRVYAECRKRHTEVRKAMKPQVRPPIYRHW
jgi:hypothetical protein